MTKRGDADKPIDLSGLVRSGPADDRLDTDAVARLTDDKHISLTGWFPCNCGHKQHDGVCLVPVPNPTGGDALMICGCDLAPA